MDFSKRAGFALASASRLHARSASRKHRASPAQPVSQPIMIRSLIDGDRASSGPAREYYPLLDCATIGGGGGAARGPR